MRSSPKRKCTSLGRRRHVNYFNDTNVELKRSFAEMAEVTTQKQQSQVDEHGPENEALRK